MIDCIAESEVLTYAAQLITASAIVNIVCWAAFIWGVFRFRRMVREWKAAVGIR